jgi:hypothetical protein
MVEAIRKLTHLLDAARAVSPDCEVRFKGTQDEDKWVCLVAVGAATIFESKPGGIEDVMDSATTKMKGVSKRMLAALDESPTEPASKPKP